MKRNIELEKSLNGLLDKKRELQIELEIICVKENVIFMQNKYNNLLEYTDVLNDMLQDKYVEETGVSDMLFSVMQKMDKVCVELEEEIRSLNNGELLN